MTKWLPLVVVSCVLCSTTPAFAQPPPVYVFFDTGYPKVNVTPPSYTISGQGTYKYPPGCDRIKAVVMFVSPKDGGTLTNAGGQDLGNKTWGQASAMVGAGTYSVWTIITFSNVMNQDNIQVSAVFVRPVP